MSASCFVKKRPGKVLKMEKNDFIKEEDYLALMAILAVVSILYTLIAF
jgi:hypothetical protein